MPTQLAKSPIGHEIVHMEGGSLDGAQAVVRRGSDEWVHVAETAEHLYCRAEYPWRLFRYMGGRRRKERDGRRDGLNF